MIGYYATTTVLTLLGLILLMSVYERKKLNHYSIMVQLLMTIANGGYLALALSETISEAALANKLCYLGGCFIPPLWLMLICTVCNLQFNRWVKALMYTYSFVVYAMVLTIGYNEFYYDTMVLEQYKGATVLVHTYGPGHNFFYVILYGYMLIQIVLLVYTMLTKKGGIQKKSVGSDYHGSIKCRLLCGKPLDEFCGRNYAGYVFAGYHGSFISAVPGLSV